MRHRLLLLAALVGLAGCSNREHLNPLDPGNPATGGMPGGFVALAGNGSASLSWQAPVSAGVIGFRLSRRVGAEPEFHTLIDLLPDETAYFETGLANGVDHAYRLQFRLIGDALGRAAEDVATPGAAIPWVVDNSARELIRLTPDARHVAEHYVGTLVSPTGVAVDPATGLVWVCDPAAGRLLRYTPGFQDPEEYGAFSEPAAVAVDPSNSRAWVCDDRLGWLQCFVPSNPVIPVADIRGLATPLSVAIDPRDHSAWVCERTGNLVRRVGPTGGTIASGRVREPSRVAVDSLSRRAWVTSFSTRQVTLVDVDGAVLDSITGLGGPIGIAIDPGTGRVWIADTGGDQVIVVDRSGVERLRLTGLPQPREIALDPIRGEAWITLPPIGQIARFKYDGTPLRRAMGLFTPYDIAIDARP
jgi:streptogramin lyase